MAKDVLTAVRGTSPLSFEVADLLRHPGASMPLRFRAAVEGLRLPLAQVVPGSELAFDLHIDALVDGLNVRGEIDAELALECARCLRAFGSAVSIDVDDLYLTEADGDARADDADTYSLDHETLDLEPSVRDAVLLALPLNPMCREDCKGLCPTCGVDRNETDCGHTQEKQDIRWEALERLRDHLEG